MQAETVLDRIVAHKRQEIQRRKEAAGRGEAQAALPAPLNAHRDFSAALRAPGVSLIAEIKRASPSRGSLRPGLDARALAEAYAVNGASAMSVLTDARFFRGSLDDLSAARRATPVPVLRKDFILDPFQVYESRAVGADAILLIVAALDDDELQTLQALARDLGMAALVEVHDDSELKRALAAGASPIGINNRNLHTLEVCLDTTLALRPRIPEGVIVVAESGIHTASDVARLVDAGVDAMLVGTALVTAADPGAYAQALVRAGKAVPRRRPSSEPKGDR